MALRIRYQYPSGSSLGYSIERLADGAYFDFSDSTFKPSPATLVRTLPEDTGSFRGRYRDNLNPTPPAQFLAGDYALTIHNQAASDSVIGQLAVTMSAGDDATVIPSDPWVASLPGSYAAGTAGAMLGGNLDVPVSSRSTYAGGVVAGVASPVTVGTINDKSGYVLAAAGLDAVIVEPGINARQALAPVLAAAAGTLSGSGSGNVIIGAGSTQSAGASPPSRIVATTDDAGNRTSVTLYLPA